MRSYGFRILSFCMRARKVLRSRPRISDALLLPLIFQRVCSKTRRIARRLSSDSSGVSFIVSSRIFRPTIQDPARLPQFQWADRFHPIKLCRLLNSTILALYLNPGKFNNTDDILHFQSEKTEARCRSV
jgi:hypothetical protein